MRSYRANWPRRVVIAGLVVWSVGPILVALVTSVSTTAEVEASPPVWIPTHLSLSGYSALLGHGGTGTSRAGSEAGSFLRSMLNSGTVTLEATAVILILAVLAGYAFARLRFPGRRIVMALVLLTLIAPVFAVATPLFRIMADLRLIDTQLGLVLLYVSAFVPLAIWMFMNYCRDLPPEPEDAALIDGCTRLQALWKVVLPQMFPGIVALLGILFLIVWSQFLIPLIFATTLSTKPVTVLITELVGKNTVPYSVLDAAGILAMIPPTFIAVALNRHIRGMLAGTAG
ncbi:MAG: carbohydrate ABC transporter permease [Acidimicrobiales bacterium]